VTDLRGRVTGGSSREIGRECDIRGGDERRRNRAQPPIFQPFQQNTTAGLPCVGRGTKHPATPVIQKGSLPGQQLRALNGSGGGYFSSGRICREARIFSAGVPSQRTARTVMSSACGPLPRNFDTVRVSEFTVSAALPKQAS